MSLLVVALAVALRVAWVLLVPSKPVGDFAMYVEAAAHLVEHGSLDSEYVYMPGYVLLIAPVQALGGGWLATKLVGACLGGLGAGAVYGITQRLTGRRSVATVAGLLYAFWPAGIALASVTGTDMPAAVLVLAASYFLVRFAGPRPILAAILFGVFAGLGSYVRAIMFPLAALSVLVFRAASKSWRRSLILAALACTVALAVLSPWVVRNRLRYGETFLTDSHGGLTALVGANPNTLGCYSRSLNRMFRDVTGFTLLAEPHREADRAALAEARTWVGFDRAYSLGLLASKAERLLVHERALLYWPLFRAGVLPEPYRSFFASRQAAIEATADGFYLVVFALALAGVAVAFVRRYWLALSVLPQALALAVLYATIFSEPRYRLPIFMLLLPFAALACHWLFEVVRNLVRGTPLPGVGREAIGAGVLVALVFAGGPTLAWAGAELRRQHAWAVSECWLDEKPRFCKWRAREGARGLVGAWDGLGLGLPVLSSGGENRQAATEVEISLPVGEYEASAALELLPTPPPDSLARGSIRLRTFDHAISSQVAISDVADRGREGTHYGWTASFGHRGGALVLRIEADSPSTSDLATRLWVSNLRIVRVPPNRGFPSQKSNEAGRDVRD